MSVVNIIAANTSKDKTIMHLLRGLHFICTFYNINLRATHIQGIRNLSADAISHDNLQVLLSRATMADSGPVATRLAVTELERLARHFIKDNIADSTRRVYSTGQATYFNFCKKFNLQPLPAPEQQLIPFMADLSQRLSYSSIQSYLSAV